MSGRKDNGRNALALALSTVFHVIILGVIINQAPPEYVYPEPVAAPAMEVEIVSMPRMPPITPPKVEPPKEKPQPTPPPAPAKPVPPKPVPPKPEQPKPEPAKPTPPKPTPPKPSPLPALVAPAPAQTPRAAAKPQAKVTLAAPTPIQAAAKPTLATPVSRPSLLNIHKALLQAPASVPTLPMAPAAGPAGKPGSPASGAATAASAGAAGQSRLNGLSPYPYGAMPSGGPGLRGTLVGCANAEAVRLSGAERAHCNERFGVDIAHAPALDAISRAKRAEFDKAADRQEADRKYHNSTTDSVYAPSDPGGIAHGPASSETFKHNAGEPK